MLSSFQLWPWEAVPREVLSTYPSVPSLQTGDFPLQLSHLHLVIPLLTPLSFFLLIPSSALFPLIIPQWCFSFFYHCLHLLTTMAGGPYEAEA